MIDDLRPQIVEQFREVITKFDGEFSLLIQYLNLNTDVESIRWISRTPDTDYSDVDNLMKINYGKVMKAPAIYEFDNGHRYIVEVNETIFDAMNTTERESFMFYLLSRIHISFSKRTGDTRFGLCSHYSASKAVERVFGSAQNLPSPHQLAVRFTNDA